MKGSIALLIGALLLAVGSWILSTKLEGWNQLGNPQILAGLLMAVGGVVTSWFSDKPKQVIAQWKAHRAAKNL